MRLDDGAYRDLVEVRAREPERIAKALATRPRRRAPLGPDGRLFIVAADHPARGALAIGGDRLAMADRRLLLSRLLTALDHPRVDGVLASADVIEDLALLGALDGRLAIGTMNRGGLAGATWELDDRFTSYDAAHLATAGLDGGKMLLRLDDDDPATAPTLESCGRAVTELADRGLLAMVEPLPYTRDPSGRATPDPRPERLVRAVAVASGLGATSAHTWLKVPATVAPHRVLAATTLPVLLLGGDPGPDPSATFAAWAEALALPTARGLVVGRALLYPPDDDVAVAVAAAARILERSP